MLAVLDLPPTTPCPPVEALFTVEEEIGLLGASALDGALLSGRTLINLDSEDWGVLYIGCAGAGESTITLAAEREPLGSGAEGLVAQTVSWLRLGGWLVSAGIQAERPLTHLPASTHPPPQTTPSALPLRPGRRPQRPPDPHGAGQRGAADGQVAGRRDGGGAGDAAGGAEGR
jgi:hypothetical protein